MLLVDSSVIIAAFRENEAHHQDALALLQADSAFFVPSCVLSECATVLKLREGFEVATKCMEFLLQNTDFSVLHIDRKIFVKATEFFIGHDNDLSFVDTVLLILADSLDAPVATFDKDLQKALQAC